MQKDDRFTAAVHFVMNDPLIGGYRRHKDLRIFPILFQFAQHIIEQFNEDGLNFFLVGGDAGKQFHFAV